MQRQAKDGTGDDWKDWSEILKKGGKCAEAIKVLHRANESIRRD